MRFLVGLIVLAAGAMLWFFPGCMKEKNKKEAKDDWASSYNAALSMSYDREASQDIIGQPFRWRVYPSPVHIGYVYDDQLHTDYDEADPLGFFLSYHYYSGKMEVWAHVEGLAEYWQDPRSKIKQAQLFFEDESNKISDIVHENRRVRQHWYAVADVIFENGDAGVLQVTYDDDGRVGGASFDQFTLVDGSYRFIQGEGMRISEERVILLDYLGLKDDGE